MARIYQDETRGSAEMDGARHFRLLSAAVVAIALSAARPAISWRQAGAATSSGFRNGGG